MKLIEKELNSLNDYIIKALQDEKNKISDDISEFLSAKSKRIRPALVFLFTKAFGFESDEKIYHLAATVELVHNSTLVHDDILDNADTRRGKVSLNYKLGNNLSVLAGDILLAVALRELVKCDNVKAVDEFAYSLFLMCKGEINQNFSVGKLPSLDEYIKKSEYKTAELFKAPLTSLCLILNIAQKDKIYNFARNFGIAFQIKDDLLNVLKTDNTKPVMSDIHNGIYTAPIIYLNDDIKNVEQLSESQIIAEFNKNYDKYIQKTVGLIKQYADRAIESIDFISDNQ